MYMICQAKPIIESGSINELVDPNLVRKFDVDQLQRMALAATLCITRASRLRPRISQVLLSTISSQFPQTRHTILVSIGQICLRTHFAPDTEDSKRRNQFHECKYGGITKCREWRR